MDEQISFLKGGVSVLHLIELMSSDYMACHDFLFLFIQITCAPFEVSTVHDYLLTVLITHKSGNNIVFYWTSECLFFVALRSL